MEAYSLITDYIDYRREGKAEKENMTKKDYVIIAKSFIDTIIQIENYYGLDAEGKDEEEKNTQINGVYKAVRVMSKYLANDNPLFSYNKFISYITDGVKAK